MNNTATILTQQRCGYIINAFKTRQVSSVSYFNTTFTSLEQFTKYIKQNNLTPVFPKTKV